MNLISHYRKLWFFNFNRLKGSNYKSMREYFAGVLVSEVEEFIALKGRKILDVGGARGEFSGFIQEKTGAISFNLDPSPFEYGSYASSFLWPKTALARSESMPFANDTFDLVICRGVLEHIPCAIQQAAVNEMFRVAKSGGYCYLMIPPWFNPFAGHGLKPFHYFPFKIAKFLAQLAYGKRITANSWEEKKLFPITFNKTLGFIEKSGFKLVNTKDTHLRLHFLTKIPFFREIMVPSVSFILKKD